MIDHADGCQVVHSQKCDCKPTTPELTLHRAADAIAAYLQEAANAPGIDAPWVDLGDIEDAQIDGHVNLLELARAAIEAAALPPVNEYQNYITLRGGPAALDGQGYQISDAVVRHGVLYVGAPVKDPTADRTRVAIYERQIKAAGPAATCEARAWIEWHFTGYREPPALAAGCHAQHNDGDCTWTACPQLRDGEPRATGRHCPLDTKDPYDD